GAFEPMGDRKRGCARRDVGTARVPRKLALAHDVAHGRWPEIPQLRAAVSVARAELVAGQGAWRAQHLQQVRPSGPLADVGIESVEPVFADVAAAAGVA